MKYLGGKHGVGKKLADFMTSECPPDQASGYLEPFCGSLGVFKHMTGKDYDKYIASDAHPDLIAMWKKIQQKKLRLPKKLSEDEYHRLKRAKSPNAMKAVAGFGLSYGGKYFAGYAQNAAGDSGRDFLNEFKNSLSKIGPSIQKPNVTFHNKTYDKFKPKNMLIYCDPPYMGTQGYSTGDFDHEKFWNKMREWSKDNCVFISEESAPKDFRVVWRQKKRRTLDHSRRFHRMEKLYAYRPAAASRQSRRRKKANTQHRRTRRNLI